MDLAVITQSNPPNTSITEPSINTQVVCLLTAAAALVRKTDGYSARALSHLELC